MGTPLHDPDFYDEDGNVTLCAQDVLFKVHRSRLTRTSIVFKSMFELPLNEDDDAEGSSDVRPIMLNDEAEEIRALLWALHVLPHEVTALFQEPANEAACLKFLRLSLVAHKYEVEHMDRWALDTVFTFLNNIPFNLTRILIHKLISVALLCAPDEMSMVEDIIRAALDMGRAELPVVLSAAEALGLSSLAGYAYVRTLTQGRWLRDPKLPLQIRTNLLAGYHAFTELWLEISRAPPTIQRHQCVHLGPCLWMWGEIWRESILSPDVHNLQPADVLGKLRAIKTCGPFLKERSGTWPEKGGQLTFVCRSGAVAVLDDRINDIEGKLVQYFRLPPDADGDEPGV
ncbi:hypothetical protein EXIGLDRAFT_734917 [Exidia glandulosa HHB12029]|uniref:BTB domain-containing protein n=1 Tax=Exidia glandulosa HHB12029 TaxID=1314781 RepID=A0A165K2X5_EXIGL|nr:hypothetical protein EXIGLDRAFT_734917 [Exidia glandulosa HHB12029]